MKKKIILLSIAAILLSLSAINVTVAYFHDTEFKGNVMTVGRVKIEQNECQRDPLGDIVEFEDDKPLRPVTANVAEEFTFDGNTYEVFDTDYCYVDKIVMVSNTGNVDAYVRTLFAFEMEYVNGEWINPISAGHLGIVDSKLNGTGIIWPVENGKDVCFERNGIMYVVGVYYYANDSVLTVGQTSHASMLQTYLNSSVDGWKAKVGDTYDILVLSQGVQTAALNSAEEAFLAAFGKIDTVNCTKWFAEAA